MEIIIREGDKDRQGNMTCPKCGRVVLITNHWGDPPKCPDCDTIYTPKLEPPIFIS